MQPAQQCVTPSLASILRAQPDSPSRTTFAWRAAAGAAMARATEVTLDREGQLRVRPSDLHWRREVEREHALLLARMQDLLGARAVVAIRVE